MRTPGPVRGSTRRGRREHQRRFQVVVVGKVNSLPDAPRRRPCGGRVPVQGVLLLVALLPRRRQDDEDREQLLFVKMGQPDSRDRHPVSHPLDEPPFFRSSTKRKRWRRAHAGDEEGASTSSCPWAVTVAASARRIAIKEAYTAHTLSVCPSLRTSVFGIRTRPAFRGGTPKVRRNPPKVRRNPRAHRFLVGYCCR